MAEYLTLTAFAGPGSPFLDEKYNFVVGGWRVKENSSHPMLILETEVHLKADEDTIYKKLQTLGNILLALFINDHFPRKIFNFNYPSIENEIVKTIYNVIGPSVGYNPKQIVEETVHELFKSNIGDYDSGYVKKDEQYNLDLIDDAASSFALEQPGWMFGPYTQKYHSLETINLWFDILEKNAFLSSSIGILQESFAWINHLASGQFRYQEFLQLSSAIILLISGLESMFFYNSDNHSDIGFKFQLIGSIFYEKFVTQEFLENSNDGIHSVPLRLRDTSKSLKNQKLSFSQFMDILRRLYGFRSKIAHGNANAIVSKSSTKDWDSIFEILSIERVNNNSRSDLRDHIFGSLTVLQAHILALISCSRENLSKGVKIVGEIF